MGKLCQLLEISRSGYYAWLRGGKSARKTANQALLRELVRLHEKYPALGLDSLYHMLKPAFHCSRGRVHRLMKAAGIHCRMLFLEADNQSIINRYKETRRTHPLAGGGVSVAQALQKERALLQPVRDHADFVLNTSGFSASKLHSEILNLFSDASLEDGMHVNVLSFGFKNGIPVEADLVMDVRFMPNPYYIEELKHKTGLDDGVRDYVFSFSQTNEFMRRMEEMMSFLLPLYSEEGKTVLVLAIGCTGGHHRSVAVAHALAEYIQNAGYPVTETHRDITR